MTDTPDLPLITPKPNDHSQKSSLKISHHSNKNVGFSKSNHEYEIEEYRLSLGDVSVNSRKSAEVKIPSPSLLQRYPGPPVSKAREVSIFRCPGAQMSRCPDRNRIISVVLFA